MPSESTDGPFTSVRKRVCRAFYVLADRLVKTARSECPVLSVSAPGVSSPPPPPIPSGDGDGEIDERARALFEKPIPLNGCAALENSITIVTAGVRSQTHAKRVRVKRIHVQSGGLKLFLFYFSTNDNMFSNVHPGERTTRADGNVYNLQS